MSKEVTIMIKYKINKLKYKFKNNQIPVDCKIAVVKIADKGNVVPMVTGLKQRQTRNCMGNATNANKCAVHRQAKGLSELLQQTRSQYIK